MDNLPDFDLRWRDVLLAGAGALIAIAGKDRRVTVAPGSMIGLGDAPVSYEKFLACIHGDDRDRVDAGLVEALAGETPLYRDQFRVRGGAWVGLRGKVVGEGSLLAILTSETERRQADEARVRMIQELAHAARSSEVFVSMLAHDLKNPIGVIAGTAQTLLADETRSNPGPSLKRIQTNATRLTRMIGHIRDYARGLSRDLPFEKRDVDLAALVPRGLAERSAARMSFSSTGDAHGTWDEARLEHAIEALVDSAREQAGPDPEIRVMVDGTDPTHVVLSITHDVVLSREKVENAFRPFGAEGEQGLGLFAARQAIVAHGANVTLESSANAGTTLRVELPRHLAEIEGSIAAEPREEGLLTADVVGALTTSVTAALYGALPLYERAFQHSGIRSLEFT